MLDRHEVAGSNPADPTITDSKNLFMKVEKFVFNPFSENTYILFDDTKECVIVDPGNSDQYENEKLVDFIKEHSLKPKLLLNTHAHIDHIMGNKFVNEQYGLIPHFHKDDLFLYQSSESIATMYGLTYSILEAEYNYLEEFDIVSFGNTKLKCLLVPGHSPGSICFYNEAENILIAGDVLFRESIGRTDLPGGNHQMLLAGISEKIFTLPDETVVYPGHMETTTVGYEKVNNPFF